MTFEEKIKQYYPPKEYSVGLLTSTEEEFINKEYSASVEDVKLIWRIVKSSATLRVKRLQ